MALSGGNLNFCVHNNLPHGEAGCVGGVGGVGEEQQKCRSRKKQVGRERSGKDTEKERERCGQRMYKQCREEDTASQRTENVCTNNVEKPIKLKR